MAYQIILVTIATLLQNTSILAFRGITINLALIILLPLAFFVKDWRQYFLLVLIAGLFLFIRPINQLPDWPAIALLGILIITYFIKDKLPLRPYFSVLLLLIITTVVINLPHFFLLEVLINVILGMAAYFIFLLIWRRNQN